MNQSPAERMEAVTIFEDWNEVDGKIYYRWRRKDEKEWHVKLTPYKQKPFIQYKLISPEELSELEDNHE